jgi:hypothetical protein
VKHGFESGSLSGRRMAALPAGLARPPHSSSRQEVSGIVSRWSLRSGVSGSNTPPSGRRRRHKISPRGFTLAAGLLVSCSTAPATQQSRKELLEKATTGMREMNRENPEAGAFASKGSGYAIFPEVTTGGLVFGGAYGRGVVYERGQHIGYADLR